ncbi:MAG: 5-bromo-4-chloroindolyl phosphate hydrolysis family protein, partial [Clostridia bacterium]|nr:5-bromo-4-chloroindolyl phosphate hydrolysis family protein [Clostridia bacterium]
DRVKDHPEVIPDLKKMMDYYLPMTVKLLQAYADMDAQPVQGETIQNSKREIEGTLDTLNLAFEKILDELFQDTALDISSDITVLNTMLAREGLTEDELMEVLKNIHARGMKAAMSLKPKFPAETVFPFMEELDMVLIMTVEPGFGGQKFMPDMLEKIAAVRRHANEMGKDMDIQVDGGINAANAALAAAYGANVFVVGTASFRAPDMKVALDDVKKAAEEAYGKNL